jgi:hypothetical protein
MPKAVLFDQTGPATAFPKVVGIRDYDRYQPMVFFTEAREAGRSSWLTPGGIRPPERVALVARRIHDESTAQSFSMATRRSAFSCGGVGRGIRTTPKEDAVGIAKQSHHLELTTNDAYASGRIFLKAKSRCS